MKYNVYYKGFILSTIEAENEIEAEARIRERLTIKKQVEIDKRTAEIKADDIIQTNILRNYKYEQL